MFIKLYEHIFPLNTKRRLLATLVGRAYKQPRDFVRYLNPSSFRYFFNYLRTASPELVERMVDEVLAQDKRSADAAGNINHLLLNVALAPCRPIIPYRDAAVDIIVPVYNAPALTKACLLSVLANSERCNVIIINDGSTDPGIRKLLSDLKSIPERNVQVVVLHNPENLGFVKTVNQACQLAKGHFVVLNSDTEVPPGWLERLFAPIFAAPDKIASVTPFSNAGMGCSFPYPDHDNPIFKGLSLNQLDSLFSRYGSVDPIEIFTGVGFCLAFNRNVVEKIALFDEKTFGRGYGEESDWSLRAVDAGYTNVLAPNLFVYHRHGGSFTAEEKTTLQERNLQKFWKKHIRHLPRQHEFSIRDSAREVREIVSVAADAQTKGSEKRVLILDVDFVGGGTVYSTFLAAELRKAGYGIVHAQYNSRHEYLKIKLDSNTLDTTVILPKDAAKNIPALLNFFNIDLIIVNELFWWPDPPQILKQLRACQLNYLVVTHDYFMLCPSWQLMNQKGEFCHLPDDQAICNHCLATNEASLHYKIYNGQLGNVVAWRSQVRKFLDQARMVLCFSPSSKLYLNKMYPGLTNMDVLEHAIPERERFTWQQRSFDGHGKLRLGVIGSLFTTKGEEIIRQLIDSPRFQQLPVQLSVFGLSPLFPSGYKSEDGKISFLGGYSHGELPDLLTMHGINAVLIPSICPETFSYTTSEALLLGFPVLCFNLGAQADRVRKYDAGIVMDSISVGSIISAIEKFLSHPEMIADFSSNARNYEPMTAEMHFGRILEIIAESIDASCTDQVEDDVAFA